MSEVVAWCGAGGGAKAVLLLEQHALQTHRNDTDKAIARGGTTGGHASYPLDLTHINTSKHPSPAQ